jgi:hypothetical protein
VISLAAPHASNLGCDFKRNILPVFWIEAKALQEFVEPTLSQAVSCLLNDLEKTSIIRRLFPNKQVEILQEPWIASWKVSFVKGLFSRACG